MTKSGASRKGSEETGAVSSGERNIFGSVRSDFQEVCDASTGRIREAERSRHTLNFTREPVLGALNIAIRQPITTVPAARTRRVGHCAASRGRALWVPTVMPKTEIRPR